MTSPALNFIFMQDKNVLAENLLNLFDPSSYKEFQEGFFVNKPKELLPACAKYMHETGKYLVEKVNEYRK